MSSEGVVTAVSAGTATITAWASDGEHFATCSVTVQAPTTGTENGHDWVDLGLPSGLKWATCNIGATSPEEYGDYFAWGETIPKSVYSWENYAFRSSGSTFDDLIITKYNSDSEHGVVDNLTQLVLSDDAAHVNWGGNWRMPTENEVSELIDNCNWVWATQGGNTGFIATSKSNGNSVFFPAAGWYGDKLSQIGIMGLYWSSTRPQSLYYYSMYFYFYLVEGEQRVMTFNNARYYGQSIRPVTP